MPGWAEAKRQARRTVHAQFAVSALYSDPETTDAPVTCRYHSKLVTHGELGSEGFAEVLENVTRLVFNETELATLALTLHAGAVVVLTDYDLAFTLAEFVPKDGPEDIVWNVTRKRL